MSDVREVFTVLEDSTGAGQSWVKKNEGDSTTSANLAPVTTAVDKDGNFILLPVEIEGEAAGNSIPVLPAKDSSGNLAYIPLNADGEVIVSTKANGTPKRDNDTVVAVLNTATLVSEVTITATKILEDIVVHTSNTFSTLWQLIQTDDATTTVLAEWLTGPGQFSYKYYDENLRVTAGASGTQKLSVKGKQFVGAASDMHVTISAIELA